MNLAFILVSLLCFLAVSQTFVIKHTIVRLTKRRSLDKSKLCATVDIRNLDDYFLNRDKKTSLLSTLNSTILTWLHKHEDFIFSKIKTARNVARVSSKFINPQLRKTVEPFELQFWPTVEEIEDNLKHDADKLVIMLGEWSRPVAIDIIHIFVGWYAKWLTFLEEGWVITPDQKLDC